MDPDDDLVSVTVSELELLVATAIEAANPGLPGGSDELDTNPIDWLPEARAAVVTIVQLLRDSGASGQARYASGWMEAAGWLESQLLDNGDPGAELADLEELMNEEDDDET